MRAFFNSQSTDAADVEQESGNIATNTLIPSYPHLLPTQCCLPTRNVMATCVFLGGLNEMADADVLCLITSVGGLLPELATLVWNYAAAAPQRRRVFLQLLQTCAPTIPGEDCSWYTSHGLSVGAYLPDLTRRSLHAVILCQPSYDLESLQSCKKDTPVAAPHSPPRRDCTTISSRAVPQVSVDSFLSHEEKQVPVIGLSTIYFPASSVRTRVELSCEIACGSTLADVHKSRPKRKLRAGDFCTIHLHERSSHPLDRVQFRLLIHTPKTVVSSESDASTSSTVATAPTLSDDTSPSTCIFETTGNDHLRPLGSAFRSATFPGDDFETREYYCFFDYLFVHPTVYQFTVCSFGNPIGVLTIDKTETERGLYRLHSIMLNNDYLYTKKML